MCQREMQVVGCDGAGLFAEGECLVELAAAVQQQRGGIDDGRIVRCERRGACRRVQAIVQAIGTAQ